MYICLGKALSIRLVKATLGEQEQRPQEQREPFTPPELTELGPATRAPRAAKARPKAKPPARPVTSPPKAPPPRRSASASSWALPFMEETARNVEAIFRDGDKCAWLLGHSMLEQSNLCAYA